MNRSTNSNSHFLAFSAHIAWGLRCATLLLVLFINTASSAASGGWAKNLSGALHLSPAEPTDTFPDGDSEDNRLSPKRTITISVTVEPTGKDKDGAKDYELTSGPTAAPYPKTPNSDGLVWVGGADSTTFHLTNTANDALVAGLTIECIWTEVKSEEGGEGIGEGSSSPLDTIEGIGTASVLVADTVVNISFNKTLVAYAWDEENEDKRSIEFELEFTDSYGRLLGSNEISHIHHTVASPNPPSADWAFTIPAGWDIAPTRNLRRGKITDAVFSQGYLKTTFDDGSFEELITGPQLAFLPVEVRAFQDEDGPHGSAPMYAPPRPDDGQPFGDLLALWPSEKAIFRIGDPLATMLAGNQLPAGTVKWTGDDIPEQANVGEIEVQYWTPGLKHINLQIGASNYRLYVNVPETGNLDLTGNPLTDQALIAQVGLIDYGKIGASGVQMRNRVAIRYGQDGGTGGTRQDAIRHSSWNAFAAEQVGKAKTIIVTTANEFHGRYFAAAFASNCTMDLHNNDVGATAGNAYFGTTPLKFPEELIDEMEAKFDAGELWAWTPPNANVNTHWHILKKSKRAKILQP